MKDVCESLKAIFSTDTWGEVIVSFYNENRVVGLMPLGLKLSEECTLSGRLYAGSRFYNYIISAGITELKCNVCVTQDPVLFYTAIFDKSKAIEILTREALLKKYCDICFTGFCEFQNRGDIIDLRVKIIEIVLYRELPRVFTRVNAAIIEALIWFTKIPYMECRDLATILEKLEFLREIVYRSTQKKLYIEFIDLIYSKALELVREIESSRCRSGD
jgi:hypothetical protein